MEDHASLPPAGLLNRMLWHSWHVPTRMPRWIESVMEWFTHRIDTMVPRGCDREGDFGVTQGTAGLLPSVFFAA
ncbi:MAG: hypothetical protein OXF41_07835 [bacterium]|nr:hypothetical protein [bacterium]